MLNVPRPPSITKILYLSSSVNAAYNGMQLLRNQSHPQNESYMMGQAATYPASSQALNSRVIDDWSGKVDEQGIEIRYAPEKGDDDAQSDISQLSNNSSILEGSWLPALQTAAGTRLIRDYRSRPIAHSELSNVISTFKNHPDSVRGLAPAGLWPMDNSTYHAIVDRVPEILRGLNLAESVASQETQKQSDDSSIMPMHTYPICYNAMEEEEGSAAWEELLEKYKCLVCLDVLCAPHITNCEHSYCYSCLEGLSPQVQSMTEENSTSPCCPACRAPVKSLTFELYFDGLITQEVEKAPDSRSKKEWIERHQKYYFLKHEKERLAKEGEEEEGEGNGFSRWREANQQYLIIGITIAVMFMVGYYRRGL